MFKESVKFLSFLAIDGQLGDMATHLLQDIYESMNNFNFQKLNNSALEVKSLINNSLENATQRFSPDHFCGKFEIGEKLENFAISGLNTLTTPFGMATACAIATPLILKSVPSISIDSVFTNSTSHYSMEHNQKKPTSNFKINAPELP